jgi:hypothetical protein
VAEIEVAFLAEHSASCKIVTETGTVKTGDRVTRVGPPRAAPAPAPSASPRPASEAPAAPAPVYPGDRRRTGNGYGRLTGGVTVGYSGFFDSSPSNRDVTEIGARYDLAAREVAGQPIELRVRGANRQIDRTGTRGFVLTNKDTRDRLYEASLAYAPLAGRVAATVGRIGAHPFVSLGYFDGAMAGGIVQRQPVA